METEQGLYDKRRLPPLIAFTFLFLVYICTFRVFATLPLGNLHQSVSTFAIIILTVYYLLNLFVNIGKSRLTRLDLLMWIFILVNFLASYKANVVFGQPYYYGIMAQRSVLLSLSGILLISFLNNGLITIRQVESSFLIISLSLLIICYFFFLFVNPVHFTDDEFIAYSPIRGFRYRFQFALVIMLLFYSLFKISLEKKSRFAIIVLLILFYLIYFLQSRTTLVVVTISLMIYFYNNFSFREKIRNILIYGILVFIGIAILLSLGYTALFDKYMLLFNNVLNTFISETSDEPSSAMRFMELHTALSYIFKNPMLGNGFISNQWNGGWQGIFGYFYPVDIGILGNIFIYGLVGTFFIYLPFFFSLTIAKRVKSNNVFFKTCEYMLLFFFISMFFSAENIRDSGSIMFLVCLIYYFRYYYSPDDTIEHTNTVISPAV